MLAHLHLLASHDVSRAPRVSISSHIVIMSVFQDVPIQEIIKICRLARSVIGSVAKYVTKPHRTLFMKRAHRGDVH